MLYVLIWLVCGFIAAAIYKNKGRSAGAAFIIGVLLGPIGIILVLLSSTNTAALERQQLATGQAKKCPHCGELSRCSTSCEPSQPPTGHNKNTPRPRWPGAGGASLCLHTYFPPHCQVYYGYDMRSNPATRFGAALLY